MLFLDVHNPACFLNMYFWLNLRLAVLRSFYYNTLVKIGCTGFGISLDH